MKKILSLLVVAVLMLGMMSMSASAALGLSYTAQYATPVIDGVVDDVWMTVADNWTEVALSYDGTTETVCSARVKILHDDKYIYYIAECTDATIGSAADALEFYVDEDNCDDVAYCELTTQLNMQLDGNVGKGAGYQAATEPEQVREYALTTSENGYILEWAFEPVGGMPEAGTVIGIEFMYNDADADGNFINALRWNVDTASGDTAPWQSVEFFGDLTLAAYVEPEVEAPVEGEAPVDAETPVTADAGIVVAAVVMAAAAVVCKKHRNAFDPV